MRRVGFLRSLAEARRFEDHLRLASGAGLRLVPEGDGQVVWVEDEDAWAQACAELQRFEQEPLAPRYLEAESRAATLRAAEEASLRLDEERERARKERSDRLARRLRRAGFRGRPVTLGLVIASLAIAWAAGDFDLSASSPMREALSIAATDPLPGSGGLREVRGGEVWRLITPIFLHFNLLHLFFSMLWLHDLGGQVEGSSGSGRFAGLVAVLAVASNLAQYALSGPAFGGMSGVVFGLLGFAWARRRTDPATRIGLPKETALAMIAWFALSLGTLIGPVGSVAQVAGLLSGLIAGAAPPALRRLRAA